MKGAFGRMAGKGVAIGREALFFIALGREARFFVALGREAVTVAPHGGPDCQIEGNSLCPLAPMRPGRHQMWPWTHGTVHGRLGGTDRAGVTTRRPQAGAIAPEGWRCRPLPATFCVTRLSTSAG